MWLELTYGNYGLLSVQAHDTDSGIKAVYVNGYEFKELTNGVLNIRLQQFDAGYQYFTISAMDNAGNMSEVYKTANPYYTDPEKADGNEKKKQNERKRKAENHHKYIMGGIIVKYFPDCYHYDEGELNRILSVALQTRECQQIISKIKSESRETTSPQSTLPNAENESEGGTE